jgi:hypothetical protein
MLKHNYGIIVWVYKQNKKLYMSEVMPARIPKDDVVGQIIKITDNLPKPIVPNPAQTVVKSVKDALVQLNEKFAKDEKTKGYKAYEIP